jgi:CheY-like chemotaxis protein
MSDKSHVLIVEDEEILLQFLIYHVEQAGYRATSITKGGEIFDIINNDPPDLILLDLGLPDGDGLTRAQQIRERSGVPIIVLTARQGADDRLMALGLGADDYLTKPCDPRELQLRIRNVIARGKGAPQLDNASAQQPSPIAVQPPIPSVAPTKRGGGLALVLTAALVAGVGGGSAWWYMTQETAVPSPSLQPNTVVTMPATPAPAPTPASKATAPTKEISVTAKPIPIPEAKPSAETSPPVQPQTKSRTAATSYAWVMKSKCPQLPQIDTWRLKAHTDLARHVNRRYQGDWQPYIKLWVERLGKLQDIYARNSGIKTKAGDVLKGATLKTYIDQTQKRLDITICLSREAADYAYSKSLNQR